MKLIKILVTFILAFIHWLVFMIIQAIGTILAFVIFPISYSLWEWVHTSKNPLAWFLWLWLDTKEPIGDKYYLKDKGLTALDVAKFSKWKRFLHCYEWSVLRNPFWNFNYIINLWDYVKEFDNTNNYEYGTIILAYGKNLRKNFKNVEPLYNTPTLKYVDELGNYMNNRGEYLSAKYSTLGLEFCLWWWRGLPYFKFSFAGVFLWADKEIQLGMNHYRYKWRVKPYLFRRKKWFEDLNP